MSFSAFPPPPGPCSACHPNSSCRSAARGDTAKAFISLDLSVGCGLTDHVTTAVTVQLRGQEPGRGLPDACTHQRQTALPKAPGVRGAGQGLSLWETQDWGCRTRYSRVSGRRQCRAGPGSMPAGACGSGDTLTARCQGAARSDKTETDGCWLGHSEPALPQVLWPGQEERPAAAVSSWVRHRVPGH